MFFVLQAILWTTAITLTAGDASHAVIANYDEQAFHWDEVKQQYADSAKLGWKAELKVDKSSDSSGNRVITLLLNDRDDKFITEASVEIRAFHRARAAKVQKIKLLEVGAGVYSGSISVEHSGQWLVSGTAIRGDDCYLIEHRLQLEASGDL